MSLGAAHLHNTNSEITARHRCGFFGATGRNRPCLQAGATLRVDSMHQFLPQGLLS